MVELPLVRTAICKSAAVYCNRSLRQHLHFHHKASRNIYTEQPDIGYCKRIQTWNSETRSFGLYGQALAMDFQQQLLHLNPAKCAGDLTQSDLLHCRTQQQVPRFRHIESRQVSRANLNARSPSLHSKTILSQGGIRAASLLNEEFGLSKRTMSRNSSFSRLIHSETATAVSDEEGVGEESAESQAHQHRDEEATGDRSNEPLPGGLYLVGTPIGNLEDISFRAIRILKQAALILAEDTRHSGKLLRHYGIRTPMLSYHQFNASTRLVSLLERLQRGEALALISDAGMPAISDPGAHLVAACAESRVPVVPIPGPCAVVVAVAASGFLCSEFTFVGFLPDKASARKQRLAEASAERPTLVMYVAPHKLRATLEDCAAALGATRRCVVARELTKLHEELWRGTLGEAMAEFGEREPRGEMTLVVEGADKAVAEERWSEEELEQRLELLLAKGHSPSEASRLVVQESSARRKQVYPLALKVAAAQRMKCEQEPP